MLSPGNGNGSANEATLDSSTQKAEAQESVLQEAQRLTRGDRQNDYAHPLDDYTTTSALWSAILGVEVTVEKAILCMIAVKISRESRKHKRDNVVDIAGYASCLEMVQVERARRAKLRA